MGDVTLGVLVGNRGFFPDHLCETGRETILKVLEDQRCRAVILPTDATRFGAVETLSEARKCAALFKQHAEEIDGVLVTLPNFGLDVPVLIHAFGDETEKMSIQYRRDSFCGKMSVCNNLRQYGIAYSLTELHTVDPESDSFKRDLARFAGTCRVVRDLRHARIGALGARPAAFNTVRYSEKLLEAAGIPDQSLLKMAKLGVAIDRWTAEQELSATAIQCWTALEEFYGVVPCTLMSMMSNSLMPAACETDVAGLVGMYVLQSASGTPSALLDWNNNYGSDPDKGVVFHCSNLPKEVFEKQEMNYQEIIAGTVGKENTYGTIVGRIRKGPFTYCRLSTDDLRGRMAGYVGEGAFTEDSLATFGGYGVVQVPAFQKLLRHVCENGFEHHVAANLSTVADAVHEALTKYKGWEIYHHRG